MGDRHVPCPARPARRRPRSVDRLLLQALRHRARQAPRGLRQLRHHRAPAQARPHRGRGRRGHPPGPPRRRGRLHRRGHRGHHPPQGRGPGDLRGERHLLLLRPPGQGLGHRPRQGALGGLRRQGRRRHPGEGRHHPGRLLHPRRAGRRPDPDLDRSQDRRRPRLHRLAPPRLMQATATALARLPRPPSCRPAAAIRGPVGVALRPVRSASGPPTVDAAPTVLSMATAGAKGNRSPGRLS